MAQAKGVYAPLHVTTYGRGTPLSSGGGSAPPFAGGLGGLGGSALKGLSGLLDQSLEGDDKKRVAQLELKNEQLRKEEIEWRGSSLWNQENYEWEAFGREHSGHKRYTERESNLNEIKEIKIAKQMDEPGTAESFLNAFVNDRR